MAPLSGPFRRQSIMRNPNSDPVALYFPQAVADILTRLNQGGYESYAVGGCVRDALLGRTPYDWDICTSALPEQVIACFPERTVYKTGIQHGTVLLRWEGEGYEITTFRTESGYSDHRHPDQVRFVRSLKEDLARRDFTINAMAYHPDTGVVDWFGGREDVDRRSIRCVGTPEQRFQEDGLRILRALRFGARYGFTIEPQTAQAMKQCKDLLRYIAVERIFAELKGILLGDGVAEVLMSYREIFAVFLPEIVPTFDFAQRNQNHCYDVWEHIARSVANAPQDATLRLAMLFHDVGKPAAFTVDADGVGHCPGHNEVSATLTEQALRRLRCDGETMREVVTLVKQHDRIRRFSRQATLRLLSELGERQTRQLLQVMEADIKAQAPETVSGKMEALLEGYAMVDALRAANACFRKKDLAINGRDLIALGISPGVELGALLEELFQEVLDGTLENHKALLLTEARKRWKVGGGKDMEKRLEQQLAFALEIDKVKNVFRQTHLSQQGRRENDAEHSWHMALMAYLLREYANEPVDIAKVMLMCLLHDLVEIDAGDTYAYDTEGLKTQKAREDQAKERLFSLLPEEQKQEFTALFEEFEAYETPEAKFAHAMDNLQPLLLNHSNDGGDWKEHGVTTEQIYQRQSKTKLGSEALFAVTDRIIQEHIRKGNLL